MRSHPGRLLLLLGVSVALLGLPSDGLATCGANPSDAASVAAAESAAEGQCDCCGAPRRTAYVRCVARVAKAAVHTGVLRRACRSTVVRHERSLPCVPCEGGTTTTTVASTTSTTLATCQTDSDCDDGNPCTADTCQGGVCEHGCVCATPSGTTCCPGPSALCVATTTTTMPCIPFFQSGCSVTSDCCQPCGPFRAPCAVCLQGKCEGAP